MICNLKALGLALMAVFAMSAIAASAALAQQGFATSTGPFTISASETGAKGSGLNAFTAFGAKVECFGSTYVGHEVGTTNLIPSGSTQATITPKHNQKECRAFNPEENDATVETNGCDYVFHVGETTEKAGTYGLSLDISCGLGPFRISTWALGAKHETSNRLCTITIPAQNGLKGGHITNTAGSPDDTDVTGSFIGMIFQREGLCLLDGKGKETKEGKLSLDLTVKGTTAAGANTGLTISD
jgi:hypothetical protein